MFLLSVVRVTSDEQPHASDSPATGTTFTSYVSPGLGDCGVRVASVRDGSDTSRGGSHTSEPCTRWYTFHAVTWQQHAAKIFSLQIVHTMQRATGSKRCG